MEQFGDGIEKYDHSIILKISSFTHHMIITISLYSSHDPLHSSHDITFYYNCAIVHCEYFKKYSIFKYNFQFLIHF